MAADTFALDLAAFAAKAKAAPGQVAAKATIDVLAAVVDRTPVGLPATWKVNIERAKRGLPPVPPGYVGGRARANWNVSLGTPDLSVTFDIDASGAGTVARGATRIGTDTNGEDAYIVNSLPYIRPLEYEGHSRQAPAGMVRVTVAEWQTHVDRAVAQVAT